MAPCLQTTRSLLLGNLTAAQMEDCHLERPDASLLQLRRSLRLVRGAQCRKRLQGIVREQRPQEQRPANSTGVRERLPAVFQKFEMLADQPGLERHLARRAELRRLPR